MSTYYNVEWAQADIVVVKGDDVNFCLDVTENAVAHNFAGETVRAHVRTKNGVFIRGFSTSAGTIITNVNRLQFKDVPFTTWGTYCWDVEVDDGTYIMTIIKGWFKVVRDITI